MAFTWNGLRALGVDEAALVTLPEEFRQGMVARAEMLGDIGANDPSHWVDKTSSPDLHAIAILFARDATERGRCAIEHGKLIAECNGVEALSTLDLEATPPFDYAHGHFGYRDRLSLRLAVRAQEVTELALNERAAISGVNRSSKSVPPWTASSAADGGRPAPSITLAQAHRLRLQIRQ